MSPVLNSFCAIKVLLGILLGNWGKPFNWDIRGTQVWPYNAIVFRPGLMPHHCVMSTLHLRPPSIPLSETCFATHGSFGVLDLGATKTVIGSNLVKDLITNLHKSIRDRLTRCPCKIAFRFGNHGILESEQALVVPISGYNLKIAIVPGSTPFLLSNTLLRTLGAVIDTQEKTLYLKSCQRNVPLQLTPKGLFLIDLNDLAASAGSLQPEAAETHHVHEGKTPPSPTDGSPQVTISDHDRDTINQRDFNMISPVQDHQQKSVSHESSPSLRHRKSETWSILSTLRRFKKVSPVISISSPDPPCRPYPEGFSAFRKGWRLLSPLWNHFL